MILPPSHSVIQCFACKNCGVTMRLWRSGGHQDMNGDDVFQKMKQMFKDMSKVFTVVKQL